MKTKATVTGLIAAASMFAVVEVSQACFQRTCPPPCPQRICGPFTVPGGFSGTGWHMVPCTTELRPALTWGDYASGTYAPPAFR